MSNLIPSWTQLIRNLLCVIKSLLMLYQPSHWILTTCVYPYILTLLNSNSNSILFIYGHPLHLVTLIEFLICITQLLATIFCIQDGLQSMNSFYVGYTTHRRLLSDLLRYNWSSNVSFQITNILKQYYNSQINQSILKGISSVCLILIGLSFIVLASNNLHIYGKNHPKLVIEALIVMEVSLLFFLYLMIESIIIHYLNLQRINKFKKYIISHINESDISLSHLLVCAKDFDYTDHLVEVLTLTTGGIDDVTTKLSTNSSTAITSMITSTAHFERDIVTLQGFFETNPQFVIESNTTNVTSTTKTPKKRSSKTATIAATIKPATSANGKAILYPKIDVLYAIEQYTAMQIKTILFDVIYLILNFIAGYGYLMGILSYYFPYDTDNNQLLKVLMLNLNSGDADWYGNFAGDLAWTIEPFVVIFIAPIIHQSFLQIFPKVGSYMFNYYHY